MNQRQVITGKESLPQPTGYTSSDITALFRFPYLSGVEARPFGQVNTLSYSIYRDKFPVRALGHTRAKGYTKGTRTVAGSLAFTMLDSPVINQFVDMLYEFEQKVDRGMGILPDELPPFDIDINYLSELGNKASVTLIGVELAEGNQVITIDDMQVNEQYSFVAQDIVLTDRLNI